MLIVESLLPLLELLLSLADLSFLLRRLFFDTLRSRELREEPVSPSLLLVLGCRLRFEPRLPREGSLLASLLLFFLFFSRSPSACFLLSFFLLFLFRLSEGLCLHKETKSIVSLLPKSTKDC
jgi:hypothetical protein